MNAGFIVEPTNAPTLRWDLYKKAGLERIKIISADGAADFMRRELNEMSEDEFKAFCDFQLAIAERQDLVGAGSHTVDILKVIK